MKLRELIAYLQKVDEDFKEHFSENIEPTIILSSDEEGNQMHELYEIELVWGDGEDWLVFWPGRERELF